MKMYPEHWNLLSISTKCLLLISEAYSEACQTSKMEGFAKIVQTAFSHELFSQNTPCLMFDKVLIQLWILLVNINISQVDKQYGPSPI